MPFLMPLRSHFRPRHRQAAGADADAAPGEGEGVEGGVEGAPPAAVPGAAPVVLAAPRPRGEAALVVLAVLASLYALHLARAFVIPVVLAIVIAYMLDPLVTFLCRRRVPRVIGASLALLALLAGAAWCAYLLQDQAAGLVDRLPEVAAKLSRSLGALASGDDSMLQKIRRAATVLADTGQPPPARVPQVVVERPGDPVTNLLLAGSLGVFAVIAQAAVVLFLTFFMLVSGDMFKRKFIKMAGTTLSQKKISVHMLDEINRQIQGYMVMLLVTNAGLGLLTWLLLKWLRLDNAAAWALTAAALHLVPYFGAALIAACIGLAAFMQSGGDVGLAALAAGGSLLIATLIGSVVTTWMTGRMARMNAVAVFVMLLLFTWLWGAWGVLLAIPIAVIAKVVADHVEGLEVLAEFLGE
ncbi:AI-2E family transporter [Cupriavidus sp. 30B13]|uniref:AI-2E family transporter n=1 Tax=Cupriavidus sp. 30B13 TaxID=3384241 RepID=UPI003B905032